MTREQADAALAGMGIARKMRGFLLDSAEQGGAGAHLKAEVTYAEGLGFAVVNYGSDDNGGAWVTPGSPGA